MVPVNQIFSDMHDAVAQRVMSRIHSSADIVEGYVTRMNFNRMLGYEPLFTDANVFDGAAFEILLNTNDWDKGLKQFLAPDQQSKKPQVLVACRRAGIKGSIVAALRGKNSSGKMSGFALSLISDDTERAGFSKYCQSFDRDRITSFKDLVKFVERDAVRSGVIAATTAERLVRHWRNCAEAPQILAVPQNRADTNFDIRKGLKPICGSWIELPNRWSGIDPTTRMSEPALDYWARIHVAGFNRSFGDELFHTICGQLSVVDQDLLTLHSLFSQRAYGWEIARCNGAAYDDNVCAFTHPVSKDDKNFDNAAATKGNGPAKEIKFEPAAFAEMLQCPQADLNQILEKARFQNWRNKRDVKALENTLDELGMRKGYRRPPRWLLPPMRWCAKIAAKTAAVYLLAAHGVPPTASVAKKLFAKALSKVAGSVAGKGAAKLVETVGGKSLVMLYGIEEVKREITKAAEAADENKPA
jgi:hypothetical protein